jgi:hypothetical protein
MGAAIMVCWAMGGKVFGCMFCIICSLKEGSIDFSRMGMLAGEGKWSGFGETGVRVLPRNSGSSCPWGGVALMRHAELRDVEMGGSERKRKPGGQAERGRAARARVVLSEQVWRLWCGCDRFGRRGSPGGFGDEDEAGDAMAQHPSGEVTTIRLTQSRSNGTQQAERNPHASLMVSRRLMSEVSRYEKTVVARGTVFVIEGANFLWREYGVAFNAIGTSPYLGPSAES